MEDRAPVEWLEKQWRARRASSPIDPVVRFSDEGLVLGAGTVLAPPGASSRDIAIDIADPRLLALLSAAHRRTPTPSALRHLRKAAERWGSGEDAMAGIHLALSRLRFDKPEADAKRLFLAEALLRAGLAPEALLRALNLAQTESVTKYNPNQPRVPAGSGRSSGEWTTGGVGAGATSASRLPRHRAVGSGHAGGRSPATRRPPAPGSRPAPLTPSAARAVAIHSTMPTSRRDTIAVAGATVAEGGAGLDLGAMSVRGLSALAAWVAGLSEVSLAAAGAGLTAFAGVLFIQAPGQKAGAVAGQKFEPGALAEYKGPGYAEHLLKNDPVWLGMLADIDGQANRQDRARGTRTLTWFADEKPLAVFLKDRFSERHPSIEVIWLPISRGAE